MTKDHQFEEDLARERRMEQSEKDLATICRELGTDNIVSAVANLNELKAAKEKAEASLGRYAVEHPTICYQCGGEDKRTGWLSPEQANDRRAECESLRELHVMDITRNNVLQSSLDKANADKARLVEALEKISEDQFAHRNGHIECAQDAISKLKGQQ